MVDSRFAICITLCVGTWVIEDVHQSRDVFGIKASAMLKHPDNSFLSAVAAAYTAVPALANRVELMQGALKIMAPPVKV